jgi:hypothetical protein
LVVEVKSAVPDVQATLSGLDRKARLAPQIALERGLRPTSISRLLVLPESSTTRRRIQVVATTLAAAYPARNVDVSRWLATPSGRLAGILFLPKAGYVDNRRGVQPRAGESSKARPRRGLPDVNHERI